ncbi:MAG: diversity-generating retroelement protein Avd [Opitutaceae bacterium]|nr:diversity-generating retroelement protein Avd [Opitutaceae bacterium]
MQQLAIVERYEGFVNYVYPVLLGIARSHHMARDRAIGAVLDQVGLFNDAGKSGMLSKLYAADAGLASLRFYLRFFAAPGRKLISQHQHQTAAIHLAEVGKMLGAWIRRVQAAKR